jgi:Ca2+-binding EF-hand superfamily protein
MSCGTIYEGTYMYSPEEFKKLRQQSEKRIEEISKVLNSEQYEGVKKAIASSVEDMYTTITRSIYKNKSKGEIKEIGGDQLVETIERITKNNLSPKKDIFDAVTTYSNLVVDSYFMLRVLERVTMELVDIKEEDLLGRDRVEELLDLRDKAEVTYYAIADKAFEDIVADLPSDNIIRQVIDDIKAVTGSIQQKVKEAIVPFQVEYIYNGLHEDIQNNVRLKKEIKEQVEQRQFYKSQGLPDSSRQIKYIDNRIKILKSQFITKDLIKEFLLGEHSDSSQYEYLFHAARLSSDPIIAPLAEKAADLKYEAYYEYKQNFEPRIQDFQDRWLEFTNTNLNQNPSMEKLYQPFIEWKVIKKATIDKRIVEVPTGEVDEFGAPEYDKREELYLKERIVTFAEHRDSIDTTAYHHRNYLAVKQEFARRKMYLAETEEEIKESKKLFKEASKELTDFINKYFEKPFTEEYYKIADNIDPVYKEIYTQKSEEVRARLKELYNSYSETEEAEFRQLQREFRNLSSTVDLNGKKKKGEDLKLAQALNEWKEGRKALYKDRDLSELEEEAEQKRLIHRERFLKVLQRKKQNRPSDEQISKLMRFFDQNSTRQVRTEEYYKELKKLREKATDLKSQISKLLGIKELGNLYEELNDKTKSYRQSNGVIDGENFPQHLAKDIKQIQENIDREYQEYSSLKYRSSKKLTKKEITEYESLRSELKSIQKAIRAYDTYETTEAYDARLEKEKEIILAKFPNATKEQIQRELETNSKWYINNHYQKSTFDPDTKEIGKKFEPIAIWQYKTPTNPDHVKFVPSFEYYRENNYASSIKDEYKSDNYIRNIFTGMASVKKGSKYDKTSPLYEQEIDSQLALAAEYTEGDSEQLIEQLKIQKEYNLLLYKNSDSQIQEVLGFINESLELWKDIQGLEEDTPMEVYERKHGYMLPSVRKSRTEKIIEDKEKFFTSNLQGFFKRAKEELKAFAAKTEEEKDKELLEGVEKFEELDKRLPTYTRLYGKIPIRYKAMLPFGQQSVNLGSLYNQFAYDDSVRKKMEGEKRIYLSIMEQLQKSHKKQVSGGGVISTMKNSLKVDNVRLKHLEEFMKSQFFGESRMDSTILGIDVFKIIDSASGFVSLSTLTHNYPGAVVNWASAQIQQLIESSGGKYFGVKDIVEGRKLFHTYFTKDLVRDSLGFKEGKKSWAGDFAGYWRFFQGENTEKIGKRSGRSGTSEFFESGFFGNTFRNATEFEIQGSLAVTLLNKEKVFYEHPGSGEMTYGTLLEAYQKLGIYSVRQNPGKIKKAVDGKVGEDISLKNEKNLISKIEGINITTNGNYSNINKTVAEKHAIGAATFFYRKYIFPFLNRRFGGAKYSNIPFLKNSKIIKNKENRIFNMNNMTGDGDRGFYIEGGSALWNHLGPAIFSKNVSIQDTYKHLSESQQDAVNKVGFDTALMIGLNLLFAMLGGYDDEDYDEYSWARLHALYQIRKLAAETDQFTIGGVPEIQRIIANPSIAWSVSTKRTMRTLEHLRQAVTGDEAAYYQRDTPGLYKKGDLKLKKDILEAMGLRFRTQYPEQLLKNFRYAERIR